MPVQTGGAVQQWLDTNHVWVGETGRLLVTNSSITHHTCKKKKKKKWGWGALGKIPKKGLDLRSVKYDIWLCLKSNHNDLMVNATQLMNIPSIRNFILYFCPKISTIFRRNALPTFCRSDTHRLNIHKIHNKTKTFSRYSTSNTSHHCAPHIRIAQIFSCSRRL